MTDARSRGRVLMLGALNSPHLEHMAAEMAARGLEVVAAGYVSPTLRPPEYPAPIAVHRMPDRALSRVGLPFHVRWLRDLAKRVSPDVVQAHGLAMFGFSAAVARIRPLVGVAWGSDVLTNSPRLLAQDRYAIRHSTLVMGDTPMLLGRLRQLGASPGQLRLMRWGVDLELFRVPPSKDAAKAELGLAPSPVVLSPRGLADVYNPRVVIRAFEKLQERHPDAQLILKHPGADTPPEFRALGPGIRVLPAVDYADLARYFQAADVCVSVPSSDSGPRSVWEAMACGVPCLVSDLPWVRGELKPGVHALAVPIDAAGIAESLDRVLSDAQLSSQLSLEGRRLVEANHEQRAVMDQNYRALCDVIRR